MAEDAVMGVLITLIVVVAVALCFIYVVRHHYKIKETEAETRKFESMNEMVSPTLKIPRPPDPRLVPDPAVTPPAKAVTPPKARRRPTDVWD